MAALFLHSHPVKAALVPGCPCNVDCSWWLVLDSLWFIPDIASEQLQATDAREEVASRRWDGPAASRALARPAQPSPRIQTERPVRSKRLHARSKLEKRS